MRGLLADERTVLRELARTGDEMRRIEEIDLDVRERLVQQRRVRRFVAPMPKHLLEVDEDPNSDAEVYEITDLGRLALTVSA